MRKATIIKLALLTCFIIVLYGNNTKIDNDFSSLLILTESVQERDGHIQEWTLHTRELLTASESKDIQGKLENYLMDWTFSKGNEKEELVVEKRSATMHQKIQLLSAGEGSKSYFLLYTVNMYDEEEMRQLIKRDFREIYSQIFHDSPRVFTCIKGDFDGKIKEVLPNQIAALLKEWKAKQLEVVSEDDFYSLSVFSEHFNESLPLPSHQMNLQIGLRKNESGAKTNFVFGTPIITTEY